jgi:hypothetical protein
MKADGAFVKPKDMNNHSKIPYDGNFRYICLLYWDLMVARLDINITEVFSPLEMVKDIIDLGN